MELTPKQLRIRSNYRTAEDFLLRYTPAMQNAAAADPVKCVMADTPTLADIKQCYGRNTAEVWVGTQLQSLSEFSGARLKLTPRQTDDTASVFVTRYFYLKVTELLLFFFRFKCGDYGRFYGQVDPMIILSALRTFIDERNRIIDRTEAEQREAERKRISETAMTRAQWLSYKPWWQAGYDTASWRAYLADLGRVWGQPFA